MMLFVLSEGGAGPWSLPIGNTFAMFGMAKPHDDTVR
jgi:hypothetical protein